MSHQHYDLIVIGGGMSGLSAAISWLLKADPRKRRVIVLEKENTVGGYVTSFKREGYLFDTVQMLPNISHICDFLGVDIELRHFSGHCAQIVLADPISATSQKIQVPGSIDGFTEFLSRRFPEQRQQVERMIRYARKMYGELKHLKVEPNWLDLTQTLVRCPRIVKNQNRTFKEFYESFGIVNDELQTVLEIFAAFSGLPSDRASALFASFAMISVLEGSYRPQQGYIKLPHALRRRIEQLGGEVATRTPVEKILVESGRVSGVRLADGAILLAENVVTTVDPKFAMEELVGLDVLREHGPQYADKIKATEMSASSMSIHLGLDDEIDLAACGLDCGYTVITTGRRTFEKLFRDFARGEPGFADDRFHAAVICPSLTTGGKQSLVIRAVPFPLADWATLREQNSAAYEQRKRKWAEFFIDKVERYLIPQLSEHIQTVDVASPATFARYSGSPTGSNYDMAAYPSNFGRRRLKTRTPIEGLFQPKFSHGIMAAMLGGMQSADMILGGAVMNGRARL